MIIFVVGSVLPLRLVSLSIARATRCSLVLLGVPTLAFQSGTSWSTRSHSGRGFDHHFHVSERGGARELVQLTLQEPFLWGQLDSVAGGVNHIHSVSADSFEFDGPRFNGCDGKHAKVAFLSLLEIIFFDHGTSQIFPPITVGLIFACFFQSGKASTGSSMSVLPFRPSTISCSVGSACAILRS
ncbi:hypothetical protein PMIN06_012050 [Paraphaeosphaeria minitans]